MLRESDARLISGIRSSHSRPSGVSWAWAWSCSCPGTSAFALVAGISFIPHFGQVPSVVLE